MIQRIRRFLPFLVCVLFALSLVGCAAPMMQSHASWSLLPSSAEVEAETARLAIPGELRAQLNEIVDQSCKTAANDRPDPQLVGQTYHDPLGKARKKMLIAILRWAVDQASEKSPEERAAVPPTRQLVPAPPVEWQPSVPVPEAEAPPLIETPVVQFGSGVASGVTIGAVPFGPLGAEIGIQLHLLPKGSYWARVGKACGEIIIGTGQIIFGCAGMTSGAGMSATGGGAAVGVPIIAGSVAIAANGCLTASHGLAEAQQLWREGDTSTNGTSASPAPTPPKLVPKTVAKQPITPAPVAKTVPAVKPAQPKPKVAAETQTTTRNKATGKTVTKKASGTTTTTQPRQTTAPVNTQANSGTTTVYYSKNPAGQVQYVGITNEFARRAAEQLRSRKIPVARLMTGLSRSDARAVEQALIEIHGLGKGGGTLLNKINSIAKTNPTYAKQLQLGYELLKKIGYE